MPRKKKTKSVRIDYRTIIEVSADTDPMIARDAYLKKLEQSKASVSAKNRKPKDMIHPES